MLVSKAYDTIRSHMAINVDIKKAKGDNALGLLRKFTRKVKTSGVLRKKRSLRYFERSASDYRKKQEALTRLERKAEFEMKEKLGLVSVTKRSS